MSDVAKILLSVVAGYALRVRQERVRAGVRENEVCYSVIDSPEQIPYALPQAALNSVEELIQRSGQILMRRVGDILYIASRDAQGALKESINIPVYEEQFSGDVIDASDIADTAEAR